MKTWTQLQTQGQQISGDASAETLVQLKADMNLGAQKFNAAINNYFTRKSKSTNMVADQQYYQLPPDCIRVIGVDFVLSADRRQPVQQVRSEYVWRKMNYANQKSNWISYYFVKGADEIGLYPTPSDDLTNGVIIYYEPRAFNLSQEDFTDGTITLTNGSTIVTHSATGFTSKMVGRYLTTTDGSDGYVYKIAELTNSSTLVLEEPYIGISGSGITYTIGESFSFPEEYHDTPLDYALSRYFEMHNNPERANYHLNKFKDSVAEAKGRYASSSASQVITDDIGSMNPWLDNTFQVTDV